MPVRKDITAHQRTRRWHDGLAAVNAATAANEIPGIFAEHGKRLDLDMVGYMALRDTSAVDAAVFAGIGQDGYPNRDALAVIFDPVLAVRVAVEKAVDAVNGSETAETLGAVLVANATTLGIDLADYIRLSDDGKDAVHDAVFEDVPNYQDEGDVKTAFDTAVEDELETEAVAAVNKAVADAMGAVLNAYADVFGIEVGEDSDYGKLSAAKKGEVHAALVGGEFADATAVKAGFDAAVATAIEAEAVAAVNAATADTMGAVITANAAVLGLTLTDYEALTELKQGEVHTAMVTGQPYADKAAVKAAFDAAVAAAKGE